MSNQEITIKVKVVLAEQSGISCYSKVCTYCCEKPTKLIIIPERFFAEYEICEDCYDKEIKIPPFS